MTTLQPESNLVSKTIKAVKTRVKSVVIRLSRKLRLTFNPQPRRRLARITAMMLLTYVPTLFSPLLPMQALANPTGGKVVSGTATIAQPNTSTTLITQTTPKAVLDWQKFSIGRGEIVTFNQPGPSSVALNRVLGGDPSQIFGTLKANGSVFLVNPAGVLFAPGANIDVGGLVGSTLGISNADFNAGNYRFKNDGAAGSVQNAANINANGGHVVLLAPQVSNDGKIVANGGSVGLGAGNRITLSFGTSGMVNVEVDAAAVAAAINNSGVVQADGGRVQFVAHSADALLATVINTNGLVRANSLGPAEGEIILDGGTRGAVQVSGGLQAKGLAEQGKGGTVQVLGDKVALLGQAQVDVSGNAGGGTVLVGGNFQGKGVETHASQTIIAPDVTIKADAMANGDGGKVVVWSDQSTRFYGNISAQGGANGGNGGMVEVSGKQNLNFNGNVITSAAKGKTGTLLLDPLKIFIVDGASGSADQDANANLLFATPDTAANTISVGKLQALGNTNITLQAKDSLTVGTEGGAAATVNLGATLTSNTLTLQAGDGAHSGNVVFNAGSSLTTGGGNLTIIAGQSGDTGRSVTLDTINLGSGKLTVTASGAVTQNGTITADTLVLTNTGGNTDLGSQANAIAHLGGVDASGKTFSLNNTLALDQTGVLKADTLNLTNNGGNTNLGSQSNVITHLGVIDASGNTFSLKNTGALDQSGVIKATTFVLDNTGGAVDLSTQDNLIANLGAVSTGGANITLKVGGALTLAGKLDAGAGNLSLTANGAVSQSGSITAATLAVSNIGGNTDLSGAVNQIDHLGAIAVSGNNFAFKNGKALDQTGVITATTLDLTNTSGNTDLGSQLNAISTLGTIDASGKTFSLKNTGVLTQTGVLTADTLALTNTGGNTSLTQANQITHLGAIDVTGRTFSLTNSGGTLDQSGVIAAGTLVLAQTGGGVDFSSKSNNISQLGAISAAGNFTLNNTASASNLILNGNVNVGANTIDLRSAKTIDLGSSLLTATNLITKSGGVTATSADLSGVTNTITLQPNAAIDSIGLADSGSTYNIDSAGIAALKGAAATTIVIGQSSGTGMLTVGGAVDLTGKNVTLNAGSFTDGAKTDRPITATVLNLNANTSGGNVGTSASNGELDIVAANLSVKTTGGGSAFLKAAGGVVIGTSDVGAGALSLTASGAVSQTDVITAATLTVTNTGGNTDLTGATNQIGQLGTVDATGKNFLLTNGQALTQSGVITTDKLVLSNTAGDVNFSSQSNAIKQLGTVDVGTHSFSLKNTVALTQSGVLTADTLTLTNTSASTSLTQANHISHLGAIDATNNAFSLTNAQALDQTGALLVNSLTLTNTAATNLSTQANAIPNLGAISNAGGNFSLKTTTGLASSGAVSINTGANALTFDLGGTFNFASATITAGDVSVQSAGVSLGANIFSGVTGTLSFRPLLSTSPINLGGGGGYNFGATDLTALKNASSAAGIVIGAPGATGVVTVSGPVDLAGRAVTLNGGSFSDGAVTTNPITSTTLNLNANTSGGNIGALAGNGALDTIVTNLAVKTTGGGSAFLKAAGGLVIDASNVGVGTLNLSASGAVSQTGVITAATLAVTNTGGDTNLTGATNQIGQLGTINASGKNFSLTNGQALTQSGVMTTDKLTLGNAAGDVNFSSQDNLIKQLGIVDVGTHVFSLKDTVALTQSGVLSAGTLALINTSGNTDLSSQSNAITQLGAVDASGRTFSLKNTVALNQSGVLKATTLAIENTVGAVDLSSQNNVVGNLGKITTNGDFKFNNTGAASSLTLTDVINVGAGNSIMLDAGNNKLDLGSLALTANSLTTKSSDITLTTADLSGISSTISVQPSVADSSIAVGGIGSAFNIDVAGVGALNAAPASNIIIGQTGGTGILTIAGAVNLANKTLTLNGGSITDGATNNRSITTATLNLNANTVHSTVGTGDIGSAATDGAIDIAVTNVSANTKGGDVYLRSVGGFNVGTSGIGGGSLNLAVSAPGGALIQSGVITAGTLALTNTTGSTNFGTKDNVISHLGTINAAGQAFTLKNTTALDQTGGLTAGTLVISNTAATTLNSPNNSITNLGAITSVGDLNLTNGTDLNLLGDINVGGFAINFNAGSHKIDFGKNVLTATNLTVQSDALDFSMANLGAVMGTITLRPNNKGATVALAGTGKDYNIPAAEVLVLKNSGASAIVIGHTDSAGALTVAGAADLGTKTLTLNAASMADETTTARTITASTLNLTATQGGIGASGNDAIDIAVTNVAANTADGSAFLNSITTGSVGVAASNVGKGSFNLLAAGAVSQAGVIMADTLNLTNTKGDTNFGTQANQIAHIGTIDAGGKTFSLQNALASAQTLDQTGVVTAGTLVLTNTSGNTDFSSQKNVIANLGAIDASGKTFSLKNTVALGQSDVLKANTLVLTNIGGNTNLGTQTNVISHLGAIDATGKTFTLVNSGGTLDQSGVITAGALVLTQTGGGIDLSAKSNNITQLGNISAAGNFTLDNTASASNLTLTGNVNVGANTIDLRTGNNAVDFGKAALTATDLTVKSSGVLATGADLSKLSGTITLQPNGAGDSITLAGIGSTYNIDSAGIAALKGAGATAIVIGQTGGTGVVTIGSKVDLTGKVVTLHGGSFTDVATTDRVISANTLNLNANGGNIGDSTPNSAIDINVTNLFATGSNAYLKEASGLVINSLNVGTGTLSLVANGVVSQTGIITAGTLDVVNSGGDTDLSGALNQIAHLDTIAASGKTFSLKNGQVLDQTQTGSITANSLVLTNTGGATNFGSQSNTITNLGPVVSTGGDFSLNNPGVGLRLNGVINAGTHAVTLNTGGKSIDFGAATLTANGLTVTSNSVAAGTTASFAGVSGTLTLQPDTASAAVGLAGGASAYKLDSNLISAVKASGAGIVIGNGSNTGILTVAGAADFGGKTVTLNAGSFTDGGAANVITADTLTLNAKSGAIGAIGAAGSGNGIDVAVTHVAVSTQGNNGAYLKSTGALDIAPSTVGGVLNLAASGALTESGIITAGTLEIDNIVGKSDFGKFDNVIPNVGTVTATGQIFSLKSNRNLSQTGIISAATLDLINNGGITDFSLKNNTIANLGTITTTGGAFALNNKGAALSIGSIDATGQNVSIDTGDKAFTFGGSSSITAQNFSVTAKGIGQSPGGVTFNAPLDLNAGAASLKLDDAANTFGNSVRLVNTLSPISVTAASPLSLGVVNTDNNLIIHTTGNLTQVEAGTVKVGGTTSIVLDKTENLNVTLANTGNIFTGVVSITSGIVPGKAGHVSLTNSTALTLAEAMIGGNLSLAVKGNLSQTGPLTVAGTTSLTENANGVTDPANANIILDQSTNKFAQSITVFGTPNLVKITNADVGAVVLPAKIGNLTLNYAGALDLPTVEVAGILDVTAGGAITETKGPLKVGGITNLTAGTHAVTLGNAENVFTGAVTVKDVTDLTLVNKAPLILGGTTIKGALDIQTTGAITQTGELPLMVMGNTKISAGNGIVNSAITLANVANDFKGKVSINNATDVTLADANAFDFDKSKMSTLNLSVGGNITQKDVLEVGGTTKLNLSANTIDIKLGDFANNLVGDVTVMGTPTPGFLGTLHDFALHNIASGASKLTLPTVNGDLTLKFDNSALELAGTTIKGNLDIATGGDIRQAGALTVTGTAKFDATAHGIRLDDRGNSFTGGVTLKNSGGSEVNIAAASNLSFDLANVGSGSFTIYSAGTVSQAGAITQSGGGAVSISGNTISLTNGSNLLLGTVGVTGGSIAISNGSSITLGTSSIGSSLTINAAGNIGQTEALTVSGAATFNGGSGANVSLGEYPNNFSGNVTIGGNLNDVSLRNITSTASTLQLPGTLHNLKLVYDNSGIILPNTRLSGDLEARAGGDITQSDAVLVPGFTKLDAGAHMIKLDNPANDFGKAVTLANSGANLVAISDANTLVLGKSDIGTGALTVSAKGAITQEGPISQTGTIGTGPSAGNVSFTAQGAAITLTDPENDFLGPVSLNNSGAFNVSIRDKNALVLAASKIGDGSLTVETKGALSQAPSGGIVQGSNGKGASFNAGANSITLDRSENDFVGGVSLSNSGRNDVVLVGANLLTLNKVMVGSGKLSVAGNGGIVQTDVIVQEAGAGVARFTTTTGVITLDNPGNRLTGDISLSNTGSKDVVIINDGVVSLSDINLGSGALSITAQGNISQGSKDTDALKQANGGGKVTFTANGGAIAINNRSNDFTGAVSLFNSGNNAVALTDANALVLGTANVGSGSLAISSGGALSQQNGSTITQAANAGLATFKAGSTANPAAITLNAADNDFTGTVVLAGGATQIQDKNSLTLGTLATGNLTVISHGNLSLGQGTVSGTLNATSNNGNISQTGGEATPGLVVAEVSKIDAGAGTLQFVNKTNEFNGVEVRASDTVVNASSALTISGVVSGNLNTDSAALMFGNTTVGGKLTSLANGAVTQSASLKVAGAASINAGRNPVTLDKTNNFSSLAVTAGDVVINDVDAFQFGASNITGKLTLSASGEVGQLAEVAVGGVTSINAAEGAVVLDKGNDFKDTVSVTNFGKNAITLADVNGLKVGAVRTEGNLIIKAQGVSQDAAGIKVSGTTQFEVGNAGLVLANAGNDFTGTVSVSNAGAAAVSLTNSKALVLGKSDFGSGVVTVKAGGAISQVDILKTGGAASFDAGSNNITLANANNFGAEVNLTGGATTINAATALKLNLATASTKVTGTDVAISGNVADLNLTASGGVSQPASLTVTGTANLKVGGKLDLSSTDNGLNGLVTIDGGSGTVRSKDNLQVALLNTGNIQLQAGKDLNVSGAAANLTTISGAASKFGQTDVTNKLSITTGGVLSLAEGASLNVPHLELTLPLSPVLGDLGTATAPLLLEHTQDVVVFTIHNGFFKIPVTAQTLFDVSRLRLGVSCVRVNNGFCRNGSGVVNGAVTAVQASAVSGFAANLVKDARLARKLKYGFGNLEAPIYFPHDGLPGRAPEINKPLGIQEPDLLPPETSLKP